MTNLKLTKGFDILIRINVKPSITRFENAVLKRKSLYDTVFFLLYFPVTAEMINHSIRNEKVVVSIAVTIFILLNLRYIRK